MQFVGGKLGIDATHKGPHEGTREWPAEIVMSDEIKALVTSRWGEYGLDANPAQMRHSSASLRQVLRR
jgi:4-hydroxy-3-polyprenylbenzoate decarboxylase